MNTQPSITSHPAPSPLSRKALSRMPLLWGTAAFLLGIALGDAFQPGLFLWLCLSGFGLVLALLETRLAFFSSFTIRRKVFSPLPLGGLLFLIAFGALRNLPSPQPTPADLAFYNDRTEVTLSGVIHSMPEQTGSTSRFTFRVDGLIDADGIQLPLSGMALVELPAWDWVYGDRLELTGLPETPPEGERFSYRDYLNRQGITTLISYPTATFIHSNEGNPLLAVIYRLRAQAYTTLNRLWSQPEASLLAGILLGMEGDITPDLKAAFQATGTAHIIAISGFNMAVVAGLCTLIFGRLMRGWKGGLASLTVITLYTLLVGAQPSVVRAAVMGGFSILALQLGRRGAGLNTLAFTAALMCLFQPGLLWSASFQLSCLATLGLVLFSELGEERFINWFTQKWGGKRGEAVAEVLCEFVLLTLAAQLATLPLIAFSFQQISLSSLLSNPLVLPIQPLVMVLSGLAVLVGLVIFPLGQLLAWLAWPATAYTIRMVQLLARIPGGVLTIGGMSVGATLGLYAVMAAVLLFWKRLKRIAGPLAGLTALGLTVVVLWQAVLMKPDGRLHLVIPGGTSGTSVYIRTPGGNRVILGTGSTDLVEGRLPAMDRHLEAVIVSGEPRSLYDMERMAESLPVGAAFWVLGQPSSRAARTLEETLRLGGTRSSLLLPGDRLQLDSGVTLTALAVEEGGTAFLLEFGYFRLLIPGGLPPEQFDEARRSAVVLITPLDEAHIEMWDEGNALLFVCPGRAALERCVSTETWLELTTDGVEMWLEEGH